MGKGNSIFTSYFKNSFFPLWNEMHLDGYYYCLFIAEISGRKENAHKSPRSFLMRITSHVLNWTFSFLYFVTKSNSNIFSFEILALLSYSDFLLSPCPSFRRGSAEWQYFDPDHPFWVLLRLPKPLTTVLGHYLWRFQASEFRKLFLSREYTFAIVLKALSGKKAEHLS